ncbi:hypothetical protein ACQSSU_28880 [Micromonospora echinospora]
MASDGVRAVCALARDRDGPRRLFASASPRTAGPLAVLRRTGFTPVGEVALDGRPGRRHVRDVPADA